MNAPAPALLPLDGQLCFALYGASMAMGRAYKPLLDRLGITYPQLLVLHALWEEDGRTIGALAARLSLASSTITPLVKRLAAAGLVARARGQSDERQLRVSLTERGAALRDEAACLMEAVRERTGLSADEIGGLTERLQALKRALAGPAD